MTKDVFILGGARTPMTTFVGALKDVSAIELGAIASNAALERTAKLMQQQAEIYDGTVKALREPASVARKLAGAKARKPDASGGSKKKSGGKPKS